MRIAAMPAPFRFLVMILAGWMMLRMGQSYTPDPADMDRPGRAGAPSIAAGRLPGAPFWLPSFESFLPHAWRSDDVSPPVQRLAQPRSIGIRRRAPFRQVARAGGRHWPDRWASAGDPSSLLMLAAYAGPPPGGLFRRAGYRRVVESGPGATGVAEDKPGSRWSGSVWLFARNRAKTGSIAAGGQLGGSQAGARITYRLNPAVPTRLAAAVRLSTPLEIKGAEGAVGLDWYPRPGTPVRVSIERRVKLERGGRDAWSAYAAGGFYRLLPGTIELDGYAQAGVVGAHARDLFADGAIRAAKVLPLAGRTLLLGGGIWGAAQPGASRLDIGPRAALRLPVADTSVTLALEGRLRVAGRARPGSGLALTIATDF